MIATVVEWAGDIMVAVGLTIAGLAAVALVGFVILAFLAGVFGITAGPSMRERVQACNEQAGIYTEYGCQVLRK